jgi:hypothetical protein
MELTNIKDLQLNRPTDWVKNDGHILFKGITTDWTSHLDFFENQDLGFETNDCEPFTIQESFDAQMDNLIENGTIPASVVSEFQTLGFMDLGRDGLPHFHSSPRFLGVMTGNGLNGNSAPAVWDIIRNYGVAPWTDLPYTATTTEAEYFAPILPAVLTKASTFLSLMGGKNFAQYHWIAIDAVKNLPEYQTALQQAPLCLGIPVVLPGWNQVTPTDPPLGQAPQHAVMCYAIQGKNMLILDHYSPYLKVLDAGYAVPYILQGIVTYLTPVIANVISVSSQIVSEIPTAPIPVADKQSILDTIKAELLKLENLL